MGGGVKFRFLAFLQKRSCAFLTSDFTQRSLNLSHNTTELVSSVLHSRQLPKSDQLKADPPSEALTVQHWLEVYLATAAWSIFPTLEFCTPYSSAQIWQKYFLPKEYWCFRVDRFSVIKTLWLSGLPIGKNPLCLLGWFRVGSCEKVDVGGDIKLVLGQKWEGI